MWGIQHESQGKVFNLTELRPCAILKYQKVNTYNGLVLRFNFPQLKNNVGTPYFTIGPMCNASSYSGAVNDGARINSSWDAVGGDFTISFNGASFGSSGDAYLLEVNLIIIGWFN